jgi:hypothetical protein
VGLSEPQETFALVPRDPNRIRPTLASIEKFWQRHPDWRLGQLLVNLASLTDSDGRVDVFNMEDDTLLDRINDLSHRLGDQIGPFEAGDWYHCFRSDCQEHEDCVVNGMPTCRATWSWKA